MIGTQVGSWLLQKLLGVGGMGRVYLAEHVVMKDLWAVKVLADELMQHDEVVARFVNEARAAAKVRHRNLIRVYQIDRVANGPWYMVLEYLEGETLASYVAEQKGPIGYGEIVRALSQVASALHALHQQGIIHRDLKPENVFLVRRDGDERRPILLDLGVASLGELSTGVATQRGTVLGTPCYMAPEQLLGEAVTPAADVYALGVMVYEMSTAGWLPYQQDWESRDAYVNLPTAEIYRRQAAGPAVDPRRRNPGISDAWAKIIFRLLDPDPGRRIGSAKSAAIDLAKAMPVDGITDGLALVAKYAPELLQVDNMLETLRSPGQAMLTPPAQSSEARYSLGAKLGAGGMAEVFVGSQLGEQGFERKVAIKRVLAELSAQPAFATMFIAEARIASRLSHSNIVSVLDFRRDAEGRLFLVMEFVEGKDLAAVLERGPLPASTIIFVIVEVLRGLGYAHTRMDEVTSTRGVVHRDISPQNVLVSYEGDVKINDFGLARVRDGGGWAGSTRVAGKPSYMSPEQVRGEPLDNRSDLWAVGVMLYEMLTHRAMFTGSMMEIMGQVQFQAFPRPSAIRAGVPADLEAVAMKLLERDVRVRYASAELAIADLLRCADAPINGRDELTAHLASRFSGTAPHRAGFTVVPAAPAMPAAYEERITNSVAAVPSVFVGSMPTTLRSAASQSSVVAPAAPRGRRGSALVWIAPVIVVAAVSVGLIVRGQQSAAPELRGGDALDTALRSTKASIASNGNAPVGAAAAMPDAGSHVASAPPVIDAAVVPPTIDARADVSAQVKAAPSETPAPDLSKTAAVHAPPPSPSPPVVPSASAKPNSASAAPTASPPPPRMTPPSNATAVQPPAVQPSHARASSPAPPPAAAPSGDPGELVILVKPWATVWINNKQAGTTPFRKAFPAGKYTVRLSNDDLDQNETVNITVEPNKPTTLRRNW